MVKTTKSVTPFALFIGENRASLSTLFFFTVMMTCFLIANPKVFTNPIIYNAVFVTLPVAIFLVVPLVFTVTGGEIDLSFPSNMAMSSWIFSLAIQKGLPPILGLILAVLWEWRLALLSAQLSSMGICPHWSVHLVSTSSCAVLL